MPTLSLHLSSRTFAALVPLLFLAMLFPALSAGSQTALVLDIEGEVNLVSTFDGFEDESPLNRAENLSDGNRVVLSENSRVVLMNLIDFQQSTYIGPGEIQVGPKGLSTKDIPKQRIIKSATYGTLKFPMLAVLGNQNRLIKIPDVVIGIRDLKKDFSEITLLFPVKKIIIL